MLLYTISVQYMPCMSLGKIIRLMKNNALLMTKPYFRKYRPQHAHAMAELINAKSKVSQRSKFVFFRIPKAASSTTVKTLYLHENSACIDDYDHDVAMASFARLSDLSGRQVRELEQDYFKFTIVRNPWSRLASAYFDKIVNEGGTASKYKARHVVKYHKRRLGAHVTFREFCDYLKFGDGLYANAHWAPQSALVGIPVSRLDFIGKLETLEYDLNHILKHIFNILDDEVVISNMRHHRTNASSRLSDLYDNYTMSIVRELYESDFVNFGYDITKLNSKEGLR